jgi:hypothetical protein
LAIAAFAGAGARGLQAAAQSGREPEAGEPEAPRLVLTASPRLGFPPLEVALTATLYGVSKDDERFCHVDRVWTLRIDPDSRSRLRNSSERPRCHHPEGEVKVEMRYYTDKVLRSPGLYHYQLTLEPKQGPPLRSNPITVQVLAGK